MTNAQKARKAFAQNPIRSDLVTRNLKAKGMSDEDVLTGLCMAAGHTPAHHATDSNSSDFGEVQFFRVLCAWHFFSVGFDISLAISIGRGRRGSILVSSRSSLWTQGS